MILRKLFQKVEEELFPNNFMVLGLITLQPKLDKDIIRQ